MFIYRAMGTTAFRRRKRIAEKNIGADEKQEHIARAVQKKTLI